jgi:hypothetical protein
MRVKSPALAAWLKIPLLLHALKNGHDWVAFLDADCLVRSTAPDFTSVAVPGKSIYAAMGRSQRYNSGMLLVMRSEASIAFFEQMLASVTEEIAQGDRDFLKYENGNFIHCARSSDAIETLDLKWNNTYDPSLPDYIRHYTGPLRPEYRRSALRSLGFRLVGRLSPKPSKQPKQRDLQFRSDLDDLLSYCQRRYPAFDSQSPPTRTAKP